MVFCQKQDLEDPLLIHVKKCELGKFCHGKLNRCKEDPYNQYENKNPGSYCKFDFECLNGKCGPLGTCEGMKTDSKCKSHSDCEVGTYCDSESDKCTF